jgi:hypothetical protein
MLQCDISLAKWNLHHKWMISPHSHRCHCAFGALESSWQFAGLSASQRLHQPLI